MYIRSMAIETTENVRLGLFLGKASRITNLWKMQEFLQSRLSQTLSSEVPLLQLIHDILGPRDPMLRSKAIKVECSQHDATILCPALEQIFTPTSKYAFVSFKRFTTSANGPRYDTIGSRKSHRRGVYCQSPVSFALPAARSAGCDRTKILESSGLHL